MRTNLEPLDPAHEASIDAYHSVLATAFPVDNPDLPPLLREQTGNAIRYPNPGSERHRFVARLGDEPVACLELGLPVLDNLHMVSVDLTVHPEHRRQGVGRELFDTATRFARERDRTLLMGGYWVAIPEGPARDPAPAA